jgi:integrase
MGTVFRKTFTKPLPAGAETFTRNGDRFAKWKDKAGKSRTGRLTAGKDGGPRVLIESPFYVAKYRNGNGQVVEESTGCRDETAARAVLANLERRAELIKAKVITAVEDGIGQHQEKSIAEHFTAYLTHLDSKEVSPEHRAERQRQLNRIAKECGLRRLSDLAREPLERWLMLQAQAKMSPRTRNTYLVAAKAFSNWCVESGRLAGNPFSKVATANEAIDPRRRRRAMTEDELARLLDAAPRRPIEDAMTIRRGPRKGQVVGKLNPKERQRLEVIGRERALIYKTLVLTGLRRGELASLTVGQVHPDGHEPYAELEAADEKNREGSTIPLRLDLAADIRGWLSDRLKALQEKARERGQAIPLRLPGDMALFAVPRKLSRLFNSDLKAAGIAKRDDRGRVLDVHALRTTFGSWLSKAGVSLRTAQSAMRHSDPSLTANVYTDPRLLDLQGAVESLPALPLNAGRSSTSEVATATGTNDLRSGALAPLLAPTDDFSRVSRSNPDKRTATTGQGTGLRPFDVSVVADKTKKPLTTAVNGRHEERDRGVEPLSPAWEAGARPLYQSRDAVHHNGGAGYPQES